MKTLERLLLESLADRGMTVKELSSLWGEDRVRVQEWCKKFCKLGLCVHDGDGMYMGDNDKISEYLRTT